MQVSGVWAVLPGMDQLRRFVCLGVLFSLLLATPAGSQVPIFRTAVTEVSTPVTVLDGQGNYVLNLTAQDFQLYDNDVRQQISAELTQMPISLVVLVGNSLRVRTLLPFVRKTGILFTQLVLGQNGEAAVITFDNEVQVVQEFTRDSTQIEKAFRDLPVGLERARLSDALVRALSMLERRPDDRRRVIVVIAEDRDMGSETDLGYALREAQLGGVSIYPVTLSWAKAQWKEKPQPASEGPSFPPGATPNIPGVPLAATTSPMGHANVDLGGPLIAAISGLKNMLGGSPMTALAKGTGTERVSGSSNRGIDQALNRIANELHSQFILTYRPNNLSQAGFHAIQVTVNRPGTTARTRLGYFLAAPGPPPASP